MQINISNETIVCVKSIMNKAGYQDIDYYPDYEGWVKRELWTIDHTLALLAEVNPYFVRRLKSRDVVRYNYFLDCTAYMEDLLLEGFPVKRMCSPEKAITIAKEKGLKIPSELKKYFLNDVKENNGGVPHGNTLVRIKLKRQVADAAIYVLKETDNFKGSRLYAKSIALEIENNRHVFIKKWGWPEADSDNVTKRPSLTNIALYINEFVPNRGLHSATSADEAAELIIQGKELYNLLPE